MTFIHHDTLHDLDPCPICKTGILRGIYGAATCDACKRSFGLAPAFSDVELPIVRSTTPVVAWDEDDL